MRPHSIPSRRGTVLIIVIGLSALLMALSLAFIAQTSISEASGNQVMRETQARLMLHAACAYILEAGRIGYGPDPGKGSPSLSNGLVKAGANDAFLHHREAFGWIDVRDGEPGPKDQQPDAANRPGYDGVPIQSTPGIWPAVGGIMVGNLYRWVRPRYALRLAAAYNPIDTSTTNNVTATATPPVAMPTRVSTYGYPLMTVPDPQPSGLVINAPLTGADYARLTDSGSQAQRESDFARWVAGDPTPVSDSLGVAWFRICRLSAATFVITCGSGGTYGFKDWAEVVSHPALQGAAGGTELFNGNQTMFESMKQQEVRLWYEVRWSAAVRVYGFGQNNLRFPRTNWPAGHFFNAAGQLWANVLNESQANISAPIGDLFGCAPGFTPNQFGTLSFIQRLDANQNGPVLPGNPPTALAW